MARTWRSYVLCGLFLWLTASLSGCSSSSAAASPSSPDEGAATCRISVIDDQYLPHFQVETSALEVADEKPGVHKAYFAMGCFWGSEAMLASAPGVLGTRVGFSGGTLPDPSYSAIGDHVETVEVVYDPKLISYSELLQFFWSHHNARAKPIFRQYASAIFSDSDEERKLAKEGRAQWQSASGEERVLTAILPLKEFYPAEDYHQKYYLQQDKKLWEGLPSSEKGLYSLLATKLNAISGREGKRQELAGELSEFGISQQAIGLLFQRARWPEDSEQE